MVTLNSSDLNVIKYIDIKSGKVIDRPQIMYQGNVLQSNEIINLKFYSHNYNYYLWDDVKDARDVLQNQTHYNLYLTNDKMR